VLRINDEQLSILHPDPSQHLIAINARHSRAWESGTEPANRATIELDALVREVAADVDFEARSRDRAVRVLTLEPCMITGVLDMLRSALENIIRNAANYTKQGAEVEVGLDRVQDDFQDTAVIRVRDFGEGVPADALESVFKPFYRVADARERSSGGFGLWLSITSEAIRLRGGQVKAENLSGGRLLVEVRSPLGGRSGDGRGARSGISELACGPVPLSISIE
jgi:signal transduction histidine kinase